MDSKACAAWSVVGTYMLIFFCALNFAPAGSILRELGVFFTGGVNNIEKQESLNLASIVPAILFINAVSLPLEICLMAVITSLLGKARGFSNPLERLRGKNIFFNLFVLVIIEELFARWLFLGVLHRLPLLSGAFGFYLLMLIGNGLWALMHLKNYKNPEDRNVIRIATQFIGGLVYAYLYVKHGLFACVLAHFSFNAVLMCMDKVQEAGANLAVSILLNSIYVAVSWSLMAVAGKPLSDISVWFDGSGRFVLEGWTVFDYVLLSVFLGSASNLVFDLLLYDSNKTNLKKELNKYGPAGTVLLVFFGILLVLCMVLGVYFLLGLVVNDVSARILATSVFLAFVGKSPSGSAAMRKFWVNIPNAYVLVCTTLALGFVGAFACSVADLLITLPPHFIKREEE